MGTKEIVEIVVQSPYYSKFHTIHPNYDMVIRYLSELDMKRIHEEFPQLNLFPHPLKEVCAITLVSRVLGQEGYPKIKFYIDTQTKKILHAFSS